MTPRAKIDVDWEVRDLLKTASRQAASYLGQLRATEALLEARKFEAFNRMSAFVVHDLKNLVAQLSLMLRNAERHSENPEFQRDMLTTVENVVERMNKLMLQLRTGATPVENARPVDLETVVRRVCAAKATLDPPIELELSTGVTAAGHEDRLEHVIGHLVQNAIDATSKGGSVTVKSARRRRFRADRCKGHGNRNEFGVHPRAIVQAIRDDQAGRHGHRRLRKLAIRRGTRRADTGRQRTRARARACVCCCRAAKAERRRPPRAGEAA